MEGRIVVIGLLAGARAHLDLGLALRRRAEIIGTVLRSRPLEEKAALLRSFHEVMREPLRSGGLRPQIGRTIPFEDLPSGLMAMARNEGVGKTLVTVAS